MPSIYVGTYALYNAGSLDGKWFDLEDYADKDDFLEACQAFHDRNNPKDEDGDPIPAEHEFMFSDHEGIPSTFISESWIDPEFWAYMEYEDHHNGNAKQAYMACFDTWDEGQFEERFRGEFNSWREMAEEFIEETGMLSEVPESLQYYFDYEAYARDMRLGGDMCEDSGFFFWNN